MASKNGYISSKVIFEINFGRIVYGKENIPKNGCLISFSFAFILLYTSVVKRN